MKRKKAIPIPKRFCFVCGYDNAQGMRLKFTVDPKELLARGIFTLAHRYQGPPAAAHGGIVAAVVDEAMGKLSRLDGIVALTAELSVEYLHPVPLGRKIIVEARSLEQNGRNYWRQCSIRDAQGKLLVRSKGRFVKVATRGDPVAYE